MPVPGAAAGGAFERIVGVGAERGVACYLSRADRSDEPDLPPTLQRGVPSGDGPEHQLRALLPEEMRPAAAAEDEHLPGERVVVDQPPDACDYVVNA